MLYLKWYVLIVAKCIVNAEDFVWNELDDIVLIVAKCIVNTIKGESKIDDLFSINSSKVYCKFK